MQEAVIVSAVRTPTDPQGKRLYPDLPRPAQHFPNGFLSWSPDGRRVAAVSLAANAAAAIWVVEPDAAQPNRRLTELPARIRRLRGITWTPDGTSLVVSTEEASSDIVLFGLTQP